MALSACLAGCSAEPQIGRPLTAEQFAARNGVSLDQERPGAGVDRAGAVAYDPPRPAPQTPAPVSADAQPTPAPVEPVSPAVAQAVSRPYLPNGDTNVIGTPTVNGSATKPGTRPVVGIGSSQAIDVFFVIMDVNGKAIFSDKVLRRVERALAVDARSMDLSAFRVKANQLLENEVRLMVKDELEVAAAEKDLAPAEKQMALARTMDWRTRQITAAGGSIEMARRRAANVGWDFDDMVREKEREFLVQQFYQRRVYGLAQAPASDVREYYERNKTKLFSTSAKVKFRVIRVDPRAAKYASKAEAAAAADQIKMRAATEDFAKLASDEKLNDDSLSRGRGGYVREDGWVTGGYRYPDVEKAAFAMEPGKVSDVLESEGNFFVIKVEEVHKDSVQAFDDPRVQDRISETLRVQQISAMREKFLRSLESQAVTSRREGAMKQLLDIVMQRYPSWSGRGS